MRNITLNQSGISRYDDSSPYVVTDNILEIKVDYPNQTGDFYLVTQNNDRTDIRHLSHNGITILKDLTAGELKAIVKHYKKGILIKTYKIEPLLLIEADDTLIGTPEIAALTKKYEMLRSAFDEYKKTVETREKMRQNTEARTENLLLSLAKFAWTDYGENVYLNGGSWEQFATTFGFKNLTEQQIKFIKGDDSK